MNISVIIPNYNQTHLISAAIRSALNQTYPALEIIVVDDGSTDHSQEIPAKFGDQVRYIRQENQGLAAARNTGIRAAIGEWIGLLDADDEWNSNYLENMVKLSKRFPQASVLYCMAQCMDADGHDLPQVVGGPAVAPNLLYEKLLRANFIIPSTVTFRRKPVVDAGYFDATLRSCEDLDLWLRLLPKATIVGASQSLVRYRIHGSSLSTNVDGMHEATRKVIEKNFGQDDGQITSWSHEKRRAYGSIYRYYLITSVQRQNNWQSGRMFLQKALEVDPTLAEDLDLFYELALGVQPNGYRGTAQKLDLHQNAVSINGLLNDVFSTTKRAKLSSLRRTVYGTANYALGLVAYNANAKKLSRSFLLKALFFRPTLWSDRRLFANLFKSFVKHSFLRRLKLFIINKKGGNSIHERSI